MYYNYVTNTEKIPEPFLDTLKMNEVLFRLKSINFI